jgi:transposase
MGFKKKHMSTFEKTTALAWYNKNVRQKDISKRLGVSLRSIQRLVKNLRIVHLVLFLPGNQVLDPKGKFQKEQRTQLSRQSQRIQGYHQDN